MIKYKFILPLKSPIMVNNSKKNDDYSNIVVVIFSFIDEY